MMSCKDCTKRVLHCHSTCSDYLAFKQSQAEIKAKIKKDDEVYSYTCQSGTRNKAIRMRRLNLLSKKL
ncbi:MAG: hypothetical protein R3Y63_11210 [Eubacteriales bacterium]